MKALLGGEVAWDAITSAVRGTKGRVFAAVGYLGSAAPEVLPLKRGDVLVCDASVRAVKDGSTRPEALATYLERGVDLWSVEGLHAKVIVLPKRVFVGSANASTHSRDELIEAVVESTDTATRLHLRDWIGHLPRVPIDQREVDRLRKSAPKRIRRGPRKHPVAATLPQPLRALTIYTDIEGATWTKASEKAYAQERTAVRTQTRTVLPGSALDALELPAWDLSRLKDGTWLSYVMDDQWLHAPALVVHRSRSVRGWGLAWLARPETTREWIEWSHVETIASTLASPTRRIHTLNGQAAERIASLFR